MLWTVAIILVVLWALGFFTVHVGGLIHLLLVAAIVAVVVGFVQRRSV